MLAPAPGFGKISYPQRELLSNLTVGTYQGSLNSRPFGFARNREDGVERLLEFALLSSHGDGVVQPSA
jgi:hypothetical protein